MFIQKRSSQSAENSCAGVVGNYRLLSQLLVHSVLTAAEFLFQSNRRTGLLYTTTGREWIWICDICNHLQD